MAETAPIQTTPLDKAVITCDDDGNLSPESELACFAIACEAQTKLLADLNIDTTVNGVNWGWGQSADPESFGLSSKVYGHGIVSTDIDFAAGTITTQYGAFRKVA